ncbi:glycine--tRNA ligase [Candidatus Gracilibacteria bacterium HOT-871]|nr:glycine--tRNA ligase [Candidatus Gracilibacteria bacterium HOT-871]
MQKIEMKDLVNLCQARGFVYQGSEIYGGLANSWDYGPYGSLLKENIKNLWIKEFVQKRDDMVLQDSAILMNSQVWVASGHVGGFSDPLIDDKNTKERFRADKLLEDLIESSSDKGEYLKTKYGVPNLIPESWDMQKQTEVMRGEQVLNPNTKKPGDWTDVKKFNLMYKTFQGVNEDTASTIYLRPETAQGIFVNFANVLRTSRRKLPFGVAQIGKAFRNEITPGNFIFRTREFEQMEIEYFCEPGTDLDIFEKWKENCKNFLVNVIGLDENNLRFRDHEKDELSHYSKATTDIEFMFPFGWGELQGIADRTDFDLKSHMTESKQDLTYFDPVNNKKFIPYVIEPSVGLTRLFLAVLTNAYTFDEQNERIYLKFEPRIAPIKVAVLPVVKKIGDLAKNIYKQLSEDFVCEYDEVGTIGKRYARMDEIGVPFCITIDSNNYENGDVTVRFRDDMSQQIVKISELNEFLKPYLK